MKAIIKIDVPDFQIGQEVNIHFKDSMVAKGVVEEEKAGEWIDQGYEEEYKRGWRDAIQAALSETHNVHTEEGTFRVVQEETLVGVGMSIERER